jgi:hypothetical protein
MEKEREREKQMEKGVWRERRGGRGEKECGKEWR